MLNELVSIGLPVKNGENLISRALTSILNQQGINFEIIVSDNKSEDNTLNIIEQYRENYESINLIVQPQTISPSDNFFCTLKRAKGKYFAWLSHDDFWGDSFLAHGVDKLKEGYDFFTPNWFIEDSDPGKSQSREYNILNFINSSNNMEKKTIDFINLHFRSHKTNIVYSIFKTDFLKKIFSKMPIEDDGAMGALIIAEGRGYVSDHIYFFKQSTVYDSISQQQIAFRENINIQNFLKHCKRFVGSGLEKLYYKRYFYSTKKKSLKNHILLFPKLKKEIKQIFRSYRFNKHNEDFKIINLGN